MMLAALQKRPDHLNHQICLVQIICLLTQKRITHTMDPSVPCPLLASKLSDPSKVAFRMRKGISGFAVETWNLENSDPGLKTS